MNLEKLEERTLPSSYTAASVSALIADINAANKAGGSNTITLTAPTTSPYVLTKVDNSTDGPTGLPVISGGGNKGAADNLTIVGNGDTVERESSGTPNFRLFDVASGGSLTLQNLTLQGGLAQGSGAASEGGAIYNQGTLVLSGVTVQNNTAVGTYGQNGSKQNPNGTAGADAYGGGIWSSGALTCENGTLIENNTARGGNGGNAYTGILYGGGYFLFGGNGGNAFGGGVYIAGGTANLTGVTLSGDQALGGWGGNGPPLLAGTPGIDGSAYGGGLCAGSGSVTLCTDTVQGNTAQPGHPGLESTGAGYGGGIYIDPSASAYLNSFTQANTINNTDSSVLNGSTANIDGTYILRNC
jgi:hypothetical protein